MPIFGDDMNELMNSKSNYPMVKSLLFRLFKTFLMMKEKISTLNRPTPSLSPEKLYISTYLGKITRFT